MNTSELTFPSNIMTDIERHFVSTLEENYQKKEIHQFVMMLCEAYLGWDTTQYLLHRQEPINQSDLLKFHWALEDLKRNRPIQHIIGHTFFCGCTIRVDENVLIPRPETEEMVNFILKLFHGKAPKSIADLCTGSGCIAIALARFFPLATIHATDLSEAALKVAQTNATDNRVDIAFRKEDLLDHKEGMTQYDLIVSNPPYICQKEIAEMRPNVLQYEPHTALFVEDSDPLIFYRALAHYATFQLGDDGVLVTEINEHLGEETRAVFQDCGFEAQIHQDFRGKERWIIARKMEKQ